MDINVQELKQKIDRGDDFVFIDVRESYEYEDFNLNAKLIPLGQFAEAIPDYNGQEEKEIVIHCRSGVRSAAAQSMMQQAGFKNVRNLTGGVLAWIDAFGQ